MNAVLWIDQKEARIFELNDRKAQRSVVNAHGPHAHRHAKALDLRVRNHPDDQHRFFHDVARALDGVDQILLVGPAQTKLHFLRYAQDHDRPVAAKVVGIESADHPTDGQLVAHLRSYFDDQPPSAS